VSGARHLRRRGIFNSNAAVQFAGLALDNAAILEAEFSPGCWLNNNPAAQNAHTKPELPRGPPFLF